MIIKSIAGILCQTYYKIRYKIIKNDFEQIYKNLGVEYLDESQMADTIRECLANKTPYCIGKIGGNEANAVVFNDLGTVSQKRLAYERLCFFAGFFPNEYSEVILKEYADVQTDAISKLDMLVYYDKDFEEYLLKKYASKKLVWVDVVGSWSQNVFWTRELEGYKVVVVHPFAELIKKQYEQNRDKIYGNSNVLPEFELRVVEAVQTIGDSGNDKFGTWFEALEYMYQEIMKEDFDIALLGCGAYGLPLAAKIKDAGKIGVHMGGDLQMLFGIRGKRWDEREKAKRWYNDAWVRPGEEYKVNGFDSVEDGCYW